MEDTKKRSSSDEASSADDKSKEVDTDIDSEEHFTYKPNE